MCEFRLEVFVLGDDSGVGRALVPGEEGLVAATAGVAAACINLDLQKVEGVSLAEGREEESYGRL